MKFYMLVLVLSLAAPVAHAQPLDVDFEIFEYDQAELAPFSTGHPGLNQEA